MTEKSEKYEDKTQDIAPQKRGANERVKTNTVQCVELHWSQQKNNRTAAPSAEAKTWKKGLQ